MPTFAFVKILGASIALLAVAIGTCASAEDLCAAAGPLKGLTPSPGSRPRDACEGLRVLQAAVAKCAAEFPDDRALQIRAASILPLERQRSIDASVLASLRQMQANPQGLKSSNIDRTLLARRIEMIEAQAAKIDAELAAKRDSAVAAGYGQLAQDGYAQTIVSSAVWRYVDGEVRQRLEACADDGGRQRLLHSSGNLPSC